MRSADIPSQLVYFSDHGEDVYDTPPHDFVWRSPAWLAEDKRDYSAYAERTYQLDHFIHTWADLSGLRYAGHQPQNSLVSPTYQPRPILVGDPGSPQRLIDLLAPTR